MNPFFAAASCFAERIRVNTIRREVRNGRALWIKQRRASARLTLAAANRFFHLARNPVQALADPREWQRWEVECFRLLHGDGFGVEAEGLRAVAAAELPGAPLAAQLDDGTLTPRSAAAAGRELRRAHELTCRELPGGWSHGDPHAGNFLHDAATDRARLIDFEVMHDPALPAIERHADDLLVFLQDLVGRVAAQDWPSLAHAFLEAYDHPATVARLVPRLILPRGIPRLWWAVRTTYLPGPELVQRLGLLRNALASREVSAGP